MKVIEMQTVGGRPVFVEVSEPIDLAANPSAGGQVAGGDAAIQIRRLEDLGDTIADVCKTLQTKVHAALVAAEPQELTLEFGVKLAGEAGLPLVTKGSVEATFKVKVTWNSSNKG